MLRRTVAIIMLALLGAVFYLWSGVKKDTASQFISLLDELYLQTEEQNWDKARQTFSALETEYKKKQRLINIVTNHELTDKMFSGLAQLKTAIKNKDSKTVRIIITDLKAEVENNYTGSQLKIENIL